VCHTVACVLTAHGFEPDQRLGEAREQVGQNSGCVLRVAAALVEEDEQPRIGAPAKPAADSSPPPSAHRRTPAAHTCRACGGGDVV
jgi:hypothetical protein